MPMRYCVRSGQIEKPTPKLQKERRTFSPLFFYEAVFCYALPKLLDIIYFRGF